MKFINKTLKNWLWVDTRSLALFRIMIGFLGLCDVLRRFPLIDVFYSDKGLNFNTTVANRYTLSLLDYFHTTGQVHFFHCNCHLLLFPHDWVPYKNISDFSCHGTH